ncbi:MAG: type I secretion system permease/ATPase [Rhodocyclaceae bacterium]|nr:type I secretion system permease/ATPase [Rhodocyclaceae bacterium]
MSSKDSSVLAIYWQHRQCRFALLRRRQQFLNPAGSCFSSSRSSAISNANDSRLISELKPILWVAAGFSLFINLMLLGPTLYMLQVFDRVLTSRSLPTLYLLTLVIVLCLLAMTLVDLARARLLALAGRRIDELLGGRYLVYLIRCAGSVNRSESLYGLKDIATLRNFLTGSNVISLFDSPWLAIFILVIFLFHPGLGLIALLGSAALVLIAWINERTNRNELDRYQDTMRRAAQFMDQGIHNADVLNSMGMTSRFAEKWVNLNRYALNCMQGVSFRMSVLLSMSKFVRQSIQVIMMGYGAYLIIHDNLSPGIMIAGTTLLGRALGPVESLIANWNGLVAARSAFDRVVKLFPAIGDALERQPLPPIQGRLQVQRVILSGRNKEHIILRQIDFELPAGQTLGIVGPSGSGKSSLAKVIAGVWSPTSGHVRIDGAEIDHFDQSQIGACRGYLPQDVELFPGTIAENIGRFDSSDRDAILRAAMAAHAYDLVLQMPEGFETRLGQGGIQLSAGQAQRIGLARALYGSPRIVILDEPNANLDTEGEQALLQALAELKRQGTTVLLVTHRPSLLSGIDHLLVMREGRVEILGPREDVMTRLGGPKGSTTGGSTVREKGNRSSTAVRTGEGV